MSKDWFHSIKSMVVEDEAEPTEAVPISHAAPFTPPSPAVSILPVARVDSIAGTDDIYNTLLKKTDFNTTKSGSVLTAKLELLKDLVGIDEKTKLQTAIKIGSAEGLTSQSVLDDLSVLKNTLNNEKSQFDAAATARMDKEVTGRQQKLNDISAQMAELQRQQTQLTAEMYEQQGKIQRGQQQFVSAFNTRSIEIDNLINKYTALLG